MKRNKHLTTKTNIRIKTKMSTTTKENYKRKIKNSKIYAYFIIRISSNYCFVTSTGIILSTLASKINFAALEMLRANVSN